MGYTKQKILNMAETEDVEFIRSGLLTFSNIKECCNYKRASWLRH